MNYFTFLLQENEADAEGGKTSPHQASMNCI